MKSISNANWEVYIFNGEIKISTTDDVGLMWIHAHGADHKFQEINLGRKATDEEAKDKWKQFQVTNCIKHWQYA